MQFGLRIPPCAPVGEVADLVVQAEQGGFDYAWLVDSQLLNREVWVTLGVAGARTSRIVLGTNVTNPLTRHVSVTAAAATTVDELTGGRLILGLGSGESSVRVMGWKTARLDQLREYVAQMRALWAGEWTAPYGKPFHLYYASGRRVPIYLAATGPKMLQLAGEIADGVIMVAGISREALEFGLRNVEIGAKRAGRRLEDLEIATGVYAHVSPDWRSEWRLAQPYAALYALRYRGTERDFGVEIPEGFGVSSLYPDLLHAEDWDGAIEATRWVSDEVLEAWWEEFCLMGSGEEIAAKIRRLESYGVNNLYIRAFATYDLPTQLCQLLAREVIPRFR
jgi:5,10-methylenetetrahydromethanopterin reductase